MAAAFGSSTTSRPSANSTPKSSTPPFTFSCLRPRFAFAGTQTRTRRCPLKLPAERTLRTARPSITTSSPRLPTAPPSPSRMRPAMWFASSPARRTNPNCLCQTSPSIGSPRRSQSTQQAACTASSGISATRRRMFCRQAITAPFSNTLSTHSPTTPFLTKHPASSRKAHWLFPAHTPLNSPPVDRPFNSKSR
jgi:hypothetical protein